MIGRAGRAPRTLLPLVIALAAALAWVLFFDRDTRIDAGAPVFSFEATAIDTLILDTEAGRLVLLTDADRRWRVRYGGVSNAREISSREVERLLASLMRYEGAAALEGTADEASRQQYGLGADEATRLTLTGAGWRETLLLGRRYPAGEAVYVAGAGRQGVFMVPAGLVDLLGRLPDSVLLRSLWQPYEIADIDTVVLGGNHLRRLEDGRWWLRADAEAATRVDARAAGYDTIYDDRRIRAESDDWRLANEQRIWQLLRLLQQTQVRDLGREALSAATDTTRIRVRIGAPDDPLHRSASFLASLGPRQDVVVRCGHGRPLVVEGQAGEVLRGDIADFVDLSLLGWSAQSADSIGVRRDGEPPLLGTRQKGKLRSAAGTPLVSYDFFNGLVRLIDLQNAVTALPPALEPPFAPADGTSIELWFADGRHAVFVVGRTAAGDEVVAWFPLTQKLLRIGEELLVTLDNAFLMVGN